MGAETAVMGALGLGSAIIGAEGASDAASTAAGAANQASQLQWQMYQQQRADIAPWKEAGVGALNALWGTPGTPATTTQGAPIYGNAITGDNVPRDASGNPVPEYLMMQGPEGWYTMPNPAYAQSAAMMTRGGGQVTGYQPGTTTPATAGTQGMIQRGPGEFEESPSYQFTLGQGLQGMQRAASATGRLGSGAYLKDATKYAKGLASEEYQNFLNRYYQSLEPYFRVAGFGTSTANTLSNATGNYAQNAGNYLTQAGQATAAGQLGQANTLANTMNWGGQQYLNYNQMQQLQNQNSLNNYWGNAQYSPQQMNSMGWL